MLPESSIRQLKKLRQEVKGKDINDLVSKDETHFPNVYWMDNPVDGGRIQSYEEFTKKDNKKQTAAFKSKLVNQPLVKENKSIAKCEHCGNKFDYLSIPESGMGYVKCPKCKKSVTQKSINESKFGEVVYCPECQDILIYKDRKYKCIRCRNEISREKYVELENELKNKDKIMELKNLIDFKEFDITKGIKSDKKISKEIVKESLDEKGIYLIYSEDDGLNELLRDEFTSESAAREKAEELYIEISDDIEHYDVVGPFESNEEVDHWIASYNDEIIHDKSFENKLNEEFTGGVNADVESKNLFGFAGVKDQTIKKIGSFTKFTKLIDPKTPKERPILNAGQFIDNDVVQGYVNRIEGSKVFIESIENPGEIVEVSIKDAVKIKKEQKEHTAIKKIEEWNSSK